MFHCLSSKSSNQHVGYVTYDMSTKYNKARSWHDHHARYHEYINKYRLYHDHI